MTYDPHARRWCPYCSALLLAFDDEDWNCSTCDRRIAVRYLEGKRWLMTADQASAMRHSGSPDTPQAAS